MNGHRSPSAVDQVAHTADELFEIVRRTSYDPRIVACSVAKATVDNCIAAAES
jgi:hypothetical protein